LKQKEKKSVKIDLKKLISIPLDGIILPLDFIEDPANPVSYNYKNMAYNDMINDTDHIDTIQGMTQLSSIRPDDELDNLFETTWNDIEDQPATIEKMTPYNYLNTSFKALTTIMDGNCSIQEMHDVENMLEELVTKFKSKISKKTGNHPLTSKYISSNPPSSKKRKHHGCNGY